MKTTDRLPVPARYVPREEEKLLFGVVLPGTLHTQRQMYGRVKHQSREEEILLNGDFMRYHYNITEEGMLMARHRHPTIIIETFWDPKQMLVNQRFWFMTKPIDEPLEHDVLKHSSSFYLCYAYKAIYPVWKGIR